MEEKKYSIDSTLVEQNTKCRKSKFVKYANMNIYEMFKLNIDPVKRSDEEARILFKQREVMKQDHTQGGIYIAQSSCRYF